MTAPRVEPSLADLWRRSARRATDTQLAACAAALPITVVASVIVAFSRPRWTIDWWPLTAVPLLVAAFGIWGIGDRELVAPEAGAAPAKWGWRLVQALAAAVAGLSGVVIVLWFLSRVVGTWIS
ncbi:MAG TPA: hypothetical protein VGH04_14030 [Gemmatimonadaceae bacterium]|jgi:hypothetical protein